MQVMLNTLLPDLQLPAIAISGIEYDSRKVKSGDLFLATVGGEVDGRRYVGDVAATAAAVLCEDPYDPVFGNDFEVPDLGVHKGLVASRFYGGPSEELMVVAVTGTNGKTSVSHYVAQAFTLLNRTCGVVGTLGAGVNGDLEDVGMTTPDAVDFQRMLFEMKSDGAVAVCVEASSHGLVQGRLNGTRIETAIFTNISRDHLDYHGSFDEYKAAKRRLFEWPSLKKAVINLDDEFGEVLAETLRRNSVSPSVCEGKSIERNEIHCVSFSLWRQDADLHCSAVSFEKTGIQATVIYRGKTLPLQSSLMGGFNLSNILAVVSTLLLENVAFEEALRIAGKLKNVKGRMDVLGSAGKPTVVIDYAHTPDALENALLATRQHTGTAIYCVMGCGGDRDVGKRSLMGEVAGRLANFTIVTSDNPRTENPGKIVEDIVHGISSAAEFQVELDRATAIELALANATADDLVLIAGKGHEAYQDIGGVKVPYSDYDVVERCLSEH